jgi:cobalt/nickel transport system permease protein
MAGLFGAAAGIDRLEQLAMADSPVHRLHPMAKLITAFAYIAAVVSFPSRDVSGLVPFLLFPVILMSLSGTPYKPLLGRLLIALPFSLMGGISNLIFVRDTAFYVGSFAVSGGMVSFVSIMLKTLLTVLFVLVLIATTPFEELSRQLTRLRIPEIICLQLVMTYRYLSLLLGEAASMFTAYTLRAGGGKGIRMKDMGSFLGQLILRSADRADRVYQAMKCRGFEGVYRGKTRGGFRSADWIYTVTLPLAMLVLRLFNLSLFFGNLVR